MGLGIFELLLVLVVAIVGCALLALPVVLIVVAVRGRAGARPDRVAWAHEDRWVLAIRTLGVLVGAAAAIWLASAGSLLGLDLGLGRGAMLAPVVFGWAVLIATIAGELVVRPAPTTATRAASLTPRRVGDYLPGALSRGVAGVGLATLALLAYTTATASPDDSGRAGRTLVRTCSTVLTSQHGPYAGSYYSGPLVAGLLVAVVLAAVAGRRIVRRPRGTVPDGSHDRLRSRSMRMVLAALGIAVCGPSVGVGLTTAVAASGLSCPSALDRVVAWGSVGLVLAACLVFLGSLAALASSGTSVPREVAVSA